MPATRDGKTWRSQFYYEDWQGVRHKKNKRGFKTKAEAERIWKKVDEKPLAFMVIPNVDNKQESDGQMLLFAPAPKNAFAALAVAFSEEDIYSFVTGDEGAFICVQKQAVAYSKFKIPAALSEMDK